MNQQATRAEITGDRRVPGLRVPRGIAGVVALTIAIVAAATTLFLVFFGGLRDLQAPVQIPWPVLAMAFYATEISVVHLQLRRDAHSFSLSEIPIVLGLFFTDPVGMLAAQLLGSFVALSLHRKQSWIKVLFNMSQFMLQGVVAILVFHLFVPTAAAKLTGAWAWLGAFVAMATVNVMSALLINLVIWLSGGSGKRSAWLDTLWFGLVVTFGNTSLALVGVELLAVDWRAFWLLAIPVLIVMVAYRAFTNQRQKNYSLESLYEASRAMQQSLDVEGAVTSLLSRGREMFRADIASITFVPDQEGQPALQTTLGPGDEIELGQSLQLDPTEGVWARVVAEGTGVLVPRPITNPKLKEHFDSLGIKDAMVAPLHLEDRILGTMMVGNRLGDVSTFDEQDLKLFETLANHASAALENARLVARLEESLAHLTEMNRMKDDFVASVSHELRTPLTSILGYVKTLLRADARFTEHDRHDFLVAIERQGERLRDLIEDLLIVSRIESARTTTQAAVIDLRELLSEVIGEFSEQIATRPLTINVNEQLPSIATDKGKVFQIVSNLIDNAHKYSPAGEPIGISVLPEGRGVTISVSDTGGGIPPELHERIFERFYQVDQSSTREKGGTGLGLYICRKLSEMLGGRLWLERSDDHGSTFSLWVPAAHPAAPTAISQIGPLDPAKQS